MNQYWNDAVNYLTSAQAWNVARAMFLLLVGVLLAKFTSTAAKKLLGRKADTHRKMIVERGIYYIIVILFAVSAMRELGFNLSVLLGAAGILTVAIGFASQTSASNLISGLFLVFERPFSVGDTIRVGETTGEVLSVDPLSVKLRTPDNLFVRIPNESLIKSEVVTLTRFPIRRIDIMVGVAYKEDLSRVREVLEAVAAKNPLCLEEPKPLYIFQGFGESSLDIQFSVWAKRENFLELKNKIHEEIKKAFDAKGIEIPFPHRTIYAGGLSDPFPVRLENEGN